MVGISNLLPGFFLAATASRVGMMTDRVAVRTEMAATNAAGTVFGEEDCTVGSVHFT
ncbi:hypothetical protein ACRQ1B_15435 [Rhizobium panacihumi]|uniref:hypothetical protein n=1 Tax=Rhizobium panacihumi TaxID=2008450 RepID=UPI003D7B8275